eukprot:GSMAST32.ASY1.ANO1.661.1 assembled CDS
MSSSGEISVSLLKRQDASTTSAIINFLQNSKASEDFRRLSRETTAAIVQRDSEDDEKLAAGINIGIKQPYTEIDVLGRTPENVCSIITKHAGEALRTGAVVVLCGLSGTGKGTTVALLRKQLPDAVTWSNGNVFRSITLLASTWFEQNNKNADFDPSLALTARNIESFFSMLEFGQFGEKKTFDIRINGLGIDVLVGNVCNTLLKGRSVSKNIPTVAKQIQGEVVAFTAKALETMSSAGKTVLLEGRRQTVDYVKSPYRYILTLSDTEIIGARRCAQQIAAAALKKLDDSDEIKVDSIILEELSLQCKA